MGGSDHNQIMNTKYTLLRSPHGIPLLSAMFLLLSGFGCPGTGLTTPPTLVLPALVPVATSQGLADSGKKPIPEHGTPMIPGDATASLMFSGTAAQGGAQIVTVVRQPFTKAARLTSLEKPTNIWDLQAMADCTGPLNKGDVLLVAFYMRCVEGQKETGEARTEFVWEQRGAPWTKFGEQEVSAGKEWKQVLIPFEMRADAPAAGTHVSFRMGYGKQIFEVADFQLLNFGSSVKIDDLPRTRAVYVGIEENAAWRKAANARIEKIRKGDVSVIVKDASGKVVPNANVTLRMTRHAFGFGSAVADHMIAAQTTDGDKYREWVTKYCSKVVIENDLKWPNFESDPVAADRVVGWLNAHDVPVKGHNLVWPSYRNSPDDLQAIGTDKVKLAKRVDDHITREVTAMKGRLVEWDVVNEPFDNHDITDILGGGSSGGGKVLAHWFSLTRSLDAGPRLVLNDYPPLDGSLTDNVHLNNFYDNLSALKKANAPLQAIGFQCHFGGTMIAPESVLKGLDRFSRLGLPITVTEFDMNTRDAPLQAAYMRDFMTAVFSHPSVDTFLMWGFWEGAHWLPDAALYNRDWTIRPQGQVFQDLVAKTWWTNAGGVTDDKGAWKSRGFYGDYTVTVTPRIGSPKTIPTKIVKGAKNVIVVTL